MKLPTWFKEVQNTPKQYTKDVSYGGRKYTAITAMYQILKASEIFGTYGIGWGVKDLTYGIIRDGNHKPLLMTLDAVFWYTDDQLNIVPFPVSTDIEFFVRDANKNEKLNVDMRKKLLTDLTTKALSKIGFSADIFLGMFDDKDYVDTREGEQPIIQKPVPANLKKNMEAMISNTQSLKDIYAVRTALGKYSDSDSRKIEILKLANDKEAVLQSKK